MTEHLFRAAAKGKKGGADSRGHGHLWGPCYLVLVFSAWWVQNNFTHKGALHHCRTGFQ